MAGELVGLCELRGYKKEGTGCTLVDGLKHCAKRSSARTGRARDCTTGTIEALDEPVLTATVQNIPPANLLARWVPPINVYTIPTGEVTHDFVPTIYKKAVVKSYYVSPTGNDAAAGDAGAPLQSISVGIAKADVDEIRLVLVKDTILWGARGFNATQPTRSQNIINTTPQFRAFAVTRATNAAPVWTQNGTYGNVFQTASVSAADPAQAVDLKGLLAPTRPGIGTDYLAWHDTVVLNAPTKGKVLVKRASVALVAANPGSIYNDGTTTYVSAVDGRNLVGDTDTMALCSAQSTSFRMSPASGNVQLYIQDIDFIGSGSPVFAQLNPGVFGRLVLNHCLIQGSSNLNGYNVQGLLTSYMFRCHTADNNQDGNNYHSVNSDGVTPGTSPNFLEVECITSGNGTTGSAGNSDNETTAHDYSNGGRIKCVYLGSSDRTLCDINFAISWNPGCYIGQALTVSTAALTSSVVTLNSAEIYLDRTSVPTGANPQGDASQGGLIRYRSPVQPFTGAGNIAAN